MKIFKSLTLVAALAAIVMTVQGCNSSNDVTGVNGGGGGNAATEVLILKMACTTPGGASGYVTGVNVAFTSGTISLAADGTPVRMLLPSTGTYTVTFQSYATNWNTGQPMHRWAGTFIIGSGEIITETFPC